MNTIVNEDRRLTGFNTDIVGAENAMRERLDSLTGRTVLVLGAGGAARAVLAAIHRLRPDRVVLTARRRERAAAVASSWAIDTLDWDARDAFAADVIVNATPVGMAPAHNEMPVNRSALSRAAVVMDLVIAPLETCLLRESKALGLLTIPGYRMAMYQAAAQFQLYTGRPAPLDVFERTLCASAS